MAPKAVPVKSVPKTSVRTPPVGKFDPFAKFTKPAEVVVPPLLPGMMELDPTAEVDLSNLGKVDTAIRNKLESSNPVEVPATRIPTPAKRVAPVLKPKWRPEEATTGSIRETAVLVSGHELQKLKVRPGVDPLLVKALDMFETIMCGGVIEVHATRAYADIGLLVAEIRNHICVKPK